MNSETSKVRGLLSRYCNGDGLDIGYGGDPIVPWAICFDLSCPYTKVGDAPQHLHGDAHTLPFKENTLHWVYSSHLIEDFIYTEQVKLLIEWWRVLKFGGVLIICAPDQQRYIECCKRAGQTGDIINRAHKESNYSLATFKDKVWSQFHGCSVVKEWDKVGEYSWCFVGRKG
jgi:SAM-dependent methyltransferase